MFWSRMHFARKHMLEEIRCHFLQKNFLKKLWLDPDFVRNILKTEMKKIEPYMLNKEIIVYLWYWDSFGKQWNLHFLIRLWQETEYIWLKMVKLSELNWKLNQFWTQLETLYNFFGNVIKNLMIPKYSEYDRVKNCTIRAILKYRNHQSISSKSKYFCDP